MNDECFELTNGFTMQCTGRGGQVRGRNNKGKRPDWLILDDVEDEESVATAEQRDKTLSWFVSSVMPAINELSGNSRILLSGTLLSSDALLVKIGKDPTFISLVFGALDEGGDPVFPETVVSENVEEQKAFSARLGE